MPLHVRKDKATPVRPPIADLPVWVELRRWVDVQTGSQNQPRFPFRRGLPAGLRARAMAVKVVCLACGDMHNPVRSSRGSASLALYATGRRADGHSACSMTREGRGQVLWFQQELGKVARPVSGDRHGTDLGANSRRLF